MTLTIALVRSSAGEARMGQSMGLLGTMSALGTALGPSLGGILLSAIGWRSIFIVQVPLALLAMALAYVCLPLDAPSGNAQRPRLWVGASLPLGRHLLANLIVAIVMMTTLVVGPFYLLLSLGLSEGLTGLVMSVGPAISIFGGVPSGRAVDTLGAERVLTIGLSLLGGGAVLLSFLPQSIGVAGYVVAICVLTPGYQLFQAANNTAVMADVPRDQRGGVSGLLSLSRNIGLVLGASAMGAIFAASVGTSEIKAASPTSIAGGLQLTFGLCSALMAVAIWLHASQAKRTNAPK